VIEAEVAVRAAIQRLTSDAGVGGVNTLVSGRIYRDLGPQSAAVPLVTVAWESAENALSLNGRRIWQDILLLVKVVDRGGDRTTLEAIGSRIRARLDEYTVTLESTLVVKFREERLRPQPPEVEGGVRYQFLNHEFRTEAHPA
jgi:hypothetical protein